MNLLLLRVLLLQVLNVSGSSQDRGKSQLLLAAGVAFALYNFLGALPPFFLSYIGPRVDIYTT